MKEISKILNNIYTSIKEIDRKNIECNSIREAYKKHKMENKKQLNREKYKHIQSKIYEGKNGNKTMWNLFYEATGIERHSKK